MRSSLYSEVFNEFLEHGEMLNPSVDKECGYTNNDYKERSDIPQELVQFLDFFAFYSGNEDIENGCVEKSLNMIELDKIKKQGNEFSTKEINTTDSSENSSDFLENTEMFENNEIISTQSEDTLVSELC
ncbi:hypothetical protein BB559_003238 [Furculomyces boomerangus]|uniref:Uncharacterized protein n=1 Tax=Furculomyces boomerangus TaxID=61424 RepID=A0A2T9YMG4_9FUNG|nr:hypothetical protein BB559_003238 [Furculomyces boomerangus]